MFIKMITFLVGLFVFAIDCSSANTVGFEVRKRLYCAAIMVQNNLHTTTPIFNAREMCPDRIILITYLKNEEVSLQSIANFVKFCFSINHINDCGKYLTNLHYYGFSISQAPEYYNWAPSEIFMDNKWNVIPNNIWNTLKDIQNFELQNCVEHLSEYSWVKETFWLYLDWIQSNQITFCSCQTIYLVSVVNLACQDTAGMFNEAKNPEALQNKLFTNLCNAELNPLWTDNQIYSIKKSIEKGLYYEMDKIIQFLKEPVSEMIWPGNIYGHVDFMELTMIPFHDPQAYGYEDLDLPFTEAKQFAKIMVKFDVVSMSVTELVTKLRMFLGRDNDFVAFFHEISEYLHLIRNHYNFIRLVESLLDFYNEYYLEIDQS